MNAQTNLPAERRESTTSIDGLRNLLNSRADRIKASLPSHIKIEKFQQIAVTAALGNPKLLECDRQSFLMACNKLALDGLLPDGREAALVPFRTSVKNGNSWEEKWLVQAMPMAWGLRKKILQSGEVMSLQTGVVYACEVLSGNFIYEIGMDPPIRHRPKLDMTEEEMADDQMVAAYSIARIKNEGGEPFWSVEVMRRAEVMKVRQMSQTGALGQVVKFGPKKGQPIPPKGPWVDWEPEMWKKTALRRHSKVLPMSSDLIDSFARDQDEERMADTAAALLSVKPLDPVTLPNSEDQDDSPSVQTRARDRLISTFEVLDEVDALFATRQEWMELGVQGLFEREQNDDIEQAFIAACKRLSIDPNTGMTLVNEETARDLDAQTLNGGDDDDDGAGGDDAPPVAEGNPWDALVERLMGGIKAAKNVAYLKTIDEEFVQHRAGLPDDVADEIDRAIIAKSKALKAKA